MQNSDIEDLPYLDLPGPKFSKRDLTLAWAIFNQVKGGGFKKPDARYFKCPDCKSEGFNTGMGVIQFVCGGEFCGDHMSEPCGG